MTQGFSSSSGGSSSLTTSEAFAGSDDDDADEGSFFLCHVLPSFVRSLTGFSISSVGFGFFALVLLFGCTYFSSKMGFLEAKANISFFPAK
jgi:hypothetical protein